MGDFVLVDPKNWEYDLHSVYSAYIGYFQVYNIPWYERSWGNFFESFDEFLGFTWPVITVTDAWTGRAHIVTKLSAINSFVKMIKTRFGETLPQAPNILQVVPFETGQRRQRHVSDYATFTRLYATLPAALLAALKARVRAGEPKIVKELWEKREKTFLAIDFEWNERNDKTVLEFGYAAVRCGHLQGLGHWPPNPDTNYRKGHYIVAEHVDKIVNKHTPTYPWQYAFGDSQTIPKAKLPQLIQTVIRFVHQYFLVSFLHRLNRFNSSLQSPDSETMANTLVLVGHGLQGHLQRLEEMKIRLPSNILILDTMVLEKHLYSSGSRITMMDPTTKEARANGTSLSLERLLISFTLSSFSQQNQNNNGREPSQVPITLPQLMLNNAGNDAFMTLFALQKLLEPAASTPGPTAQKHFRGPAMLQPMGMMPNPAAAAAAAWAVNMNTMASMASPGPMPFGGGGGGGASSLMPPGTYNGYGYGSLPMSQSFSSNMNNSAGSLKMMRPSRSAYNLADEFGQMGLSSSVRTPSKEKKEGIE
ncbi:hypothetical protein FA15DRAFT_696451 [Coprinopsis marcescibilis]|uniref:Gfd2/YDR514C-like C-terminal domain-containing protein n=1 Tax=Coprinopsis marcescibilis TaxID=230819 RepID=A0A5C3KML8_COPMA|nr:hypothetical protein FA15DRAFT_696451 [Coprinopsis marcescibilis]